MIDRHEVNRALAKAIAFKQCGKDQTAEAWAMKLIDLLEVSAIIDPQYRQFAARLNVEG